MAAPPSTRIPPIVGLIVRILTLVFLFISTVVLATTKLEGDDGFERKFNFFYAYRYLLSCTVIGLAYTLLQTALTVAYVATGKRVDSFEQLDFYIDLFMTNLLVSGAAASFGLTVDLKRLAGAGNENNEFFDKIYAASSICLLGFVVSAISTIISHLNASKTS